MVVARDRAACAGLSRQQALWLQKQALPGGFLERDCRLQAILQPGGAWGLQGLQAGRREVGGGLQGLGAEALLEPRAGAGCTWRWREAETAFNEGGLSAGRREFASGGGDSEPVCVSGLGGAVSRVQGVFSG